MKKQQLLLLFWSFLVFFFMFLASKAAFSFIQNPNFEKDSSYILAVSNICRINHVPLEDGLIAMIKQNDAVVLPDDIEKIQDLLFNQVRIQNFGNDVSEFIATMDLLFSFKEIEEQQRYLQPFLDARAKLEAWRHRVNQRVRKYHPGYQLHTENTARQYKGRGITIAVFDLFEPEILEQQRTKQPSARIMPLIRFGNPVRQEHGNAVIDIILSLAPQADILPVSADHRHENEAMQYLRDRQDVHIINMSRAFSEKNKKIDPDYATLLSEILQDKIVVKSLGNTGTDLYGTLTPLRKEKNLPIPGNPFSYDLKLIREFMSTSASPRLLFAINSNLTQNQIALTATIPGKFEAVARQSFAISGDGVFSQSSGNYESGSSFSAPQLTAVCALLWEALLQKNNAAPASRIVMALSQTAEPLKQMDSSTTGLGNIHADHALAYILNQSLFC